jgi:AcrR family transcriptional regulator
VIRWSIPAVCLSPAQPPTLDAAVLELLREVGYDRLTMDAVAARARVSKATIYRHWPGKPQLVAEVLRRKHVEVLVPADSGTLRGDLMNLLRLAVTLCVEDASLMKAMAFAMDRNPELAQLVRVQVFPAARLSSVALVRRAIDRGDLPESAAAKDLFHDLAPALLMARHLGQGEPLDEEYLSRVVDQIMLPVLTH